MNEEDMHRRGLDLIEALVGWKDVEEFAAIAYQVSQALAKPIVLSEEMLLEEA